MYGVWRFPTVVRIRLSQPSLAALGLAWAWAELGNTGTLLILGFLTAVIAAKSTFVKSGEKSLKGREV